MVNYILPGIGLALIVFLIVLILMYVGVIILETILGYNKEAQETYDTDTLYKEMKQFIKDRGLNLRLIKNDLIIEKDKLSMSCAKYDNMLLITVYNIGTKVITIEVINDSTLEKDVVTKILRLYKKSDKIEDKLRYVLEYIDKDIKTGWWFDNES